MKDYGTESYKLVRTDDPETSQDSAEKVDSATWEKQMHDWVKSKGLRGGTPTEARREHPEAPYSTIGARFVALKRKGLIVPTGDRRENSAVLVDMDQVLAHSVVDFLYEAIAEE